MSHVVAVEQVGRSFRTGAGEVHALRDVSFDVAEGGIVALVGRSGSGKTTLLNCLGGLDRPTTGRVRVDGVDVGALGDRALADLHRDSIAFVFQTFGLLPMLTAAENVALPLRLRRMPRRERDSRVAELLDLVGLAPHATQRPDELSGGQQQRVAIARALAASPRLLIADEPTGQLDADTGAAVLALLQDVVRAQGATAIIATHDPAVQAGADRVLRLEDGRLTGS